MSTPKKTLCIIPAKGGSTRFPKKNIALLNGKPLLSYAIDSAKKSEIMTDIYVSTEDTDIKEVAEQYGVRVPYLRPNELAKDPAGIVDVCLHMLEHLDKEGKVYETLIILLPTSPLRTPKDIIDAYELYKKNNAKFLMSVSEYDHTPFAALKKESNNIIKPYFPEYVTLQSQRHPNAYRANGAIIIVDIELFKKKKSYYVHPLTAYIMPSERSVDIDQEFDLKFCEFLLQNKNIR
ncbi:acylneuraminate cytidylyltransferase family protein [Halalkalibacter flavus]|uniref:acylneuraminate cytidylyltransferase family protein n=1 Tax=Halalkalibacter flavus TaxID=3090668 RepID=UPI002FC63273